MILLVDIGNSRIKWACASGAALGVPAGFPVPVEDPPAAFSAAWGDLAPRRVVCCSVAGPELVERLRAWAASTWGADLHELRPGGSAAVTSAYRDVARLGADRWANLLGLRGSLGAVDAIVVDAGTAVTVDALRADGHHPGGAILAGLQASRAALRAAAPRLAHALDEPPLPASDTAGALGAGTLVGLAGAIERVAADVATGLNDAHCVITGGDAERLRPYLGPRWIADPAVTLRGLLAHAEATCAG